MSLVPYDALEPADAARVREIYAGAFPDDLTVPFEELLVDRLLVRVGEDGPRGLALVRDLYDAERGADTGWTFLRYFASASHGRGEGSALFAALVDHLRAEGRVRLLWDVEDPDEPGIGPEHVAEHRRRIAFYERNGGRLLPARFYHPPHGEVEPWLQPMDVELNPDPAGAPPPSDRDLVVGIYRWRYGLDADHPTIHRTVTATWG